MFPPQAIAAIGALFIIVMVWLRTRMYYRGAARGVRALSGAGGCYFAALIAVLLAGWFLAPPLWRQLAGDVPISATLARVAWFLVAYYLFIPVHRVLRSRGVQLFKSAVAPVQVGE